MKYKATIGEGQEVLWSRIYDLPEQAVQMLSRNMDIPDRERTRMVRSLTDYALESVSYASSGKWAGIRAITETCETCGQELRET